MEKRKVVSLGIALLSLVTAAAITSTVAWYTGSAYLAVTDIYVGLKDPKLSISIDDEHFTNKLANDQLPDVGRFRSVSSMFSEVWLEEEAEEPIFKGGYTSGSKYIYNHYDDSRVATGGYFCQEMYLRCDINAYITLDSELTSFTPDEVGNKALATDPDFVNLMSVKYPNLSGEALQDRILFDLNNVVKSLRLSILVIDGDENDEYEDYTYHIIDPYKDKETYYGGILDANADTYYDTYNHKEVLYGQIISTDEEKTAEECIVYDDPLNDSTSIVAENLTCFVAQNAKNDQKVNLEQSFENGLEIKKENSLSLEETEENLFIPVFPTRSQKIVLCIYQEGWDFENTDFVRYSHFYVNVLFKIADKKPRF